MSATRAAVAALGAVVILARDLPAQRAEPVAVVPIVVASSAATLPSPPDAAVPDGALDDSSSRPRRVVWWAPLASAAVPGAGQAWLGQDRFVGYLAVEAYGWLRFAGDLRQGQRERRGYRALARRVARAYYPGDHPDGDFEYYERMEHWVESGVYDVDPGGALEPETDVSTFNGATWLLARQTYWEDPNTPPPPDSPAYRAALDFYARRAIRPAYRWSWRNAQLEQDVFARTIARSNSAFRRSVEDIGIITANHVLSTVDSYVTLRLRLRRSADQSYQLSATLPWAPLGRPASPGGR